MPRQLPDLLKAYQFFTSKSDSPQIFHLWCALGAIAGAAQRKILMRALYFEVHTNLYIVLTSPPGRSKKGAALRTSKNFLRAVEPKVNFATESASPEALLQLLSKITNPKHQSMTIYSMELGTLMSTRPAEMVDFLTDIFDSNANFKRSTMQYGVDIAKPWLNLMAGTTPKWLGDKLGLIALEGGLVARCIFPYSEDRLLLNSWPRETPEFKEVGQVISEDLSHIATLEGEFQFAGGIGDENGDQPGLAFRFFDAWYQDKPELWEALPAEARVPGEKQFQSRFPKMDDPRTASYYDRKHIHLLKVAMALSLSYKDELVLTLEDLHRAKILLDSTEPGMHKALGAAGKNPLAVESLRVAAQISVKKKVNYRELLIANYHDIGRKNLDIILDDLRLRGYAKQEGMDWSWVAKEEG